MAVIFRMVSWSPARSPVASLLRECVYFFIGSPIAATDASGKLLWNEEYQPYGLKINGVSEKIGFTGHVYDQDTGLTDMQARLYDPLIGRFLSTDPNQFNASSPFSFNRYAYANDNPYRNTDPSGTT